MIPLIIIAGPTATGKSDRALHLAKLLNGEIISADSMQIYRDFDIGTAKASVKNRQSVPHHFVDILNPDENYSAGQFKKNAEKVISKLNSRGKISIVTGGTGLYINALARGLSMAAPSDPEIREKLQKRSQKEGSLYNELLKLDPEAAKKLNLRTHFGPKGH